MSLFKFLSNYSAGAELFVKYRSSNLANADSISSSAKDTYKARHAVGAELSKAKYGRDHTVPVKVLGIVGAKPLNAEYNPDHPLATMKGIFINPMSMSWKRWRM